MKNILNYLNNNLKEKNDISWMHWSDSIKHWRDEVGRWSDTIKSWRDEDGRWSDSIKDWRDD